MSEKFNHKGFDKVVGIPAEIIKGRHEEMKAGLDHMLYTKGAAQIEGFEVEKTELEKAIIDFVLLEVEKILASYGRNKQIEIAKENIHILKEGGTEEYTDGKLAVGGHSTTLGSVLVDRTSSPIQFALVLFHELIHMKSYKALQVVMKEDGGYVEDYRSGFAVTSRNGDERFFESLEEAIIGHFTKRFYEESLVTHPLFANEKNKPEISRMEELEELNKLVEELCEMNKSSFKSKEEIFNLFIQAQVNGNLLPVGKLIEQTYGKGSFRALGQWEV